MQSVRQHLVSKVVLVLIAVLLGLMTILGAVLFQYERTLAISELKKSANQAAQRLANSLSYPLWNLNDSEISKSIALEMTDPNISAIVLEDPTRSSPEGKRTDESGVITDFTPDSATLAQLNKSFVVAKQDIVRGNETIGTVSIYYTNRLLNQSLYTMLLRVMGLTTLLLVVSVVALFWSIRRIVLTPLLALARAVQTAGDNQFTMQVPVASTDEIGMLATMFNKIINQVASAYHTLVREQARLQASINSLTLGYIMIDQDNRIITINEAAKSILSGDSGQHPPRLRAGDTWNQLEHIQKCFGQALVLTDLIERCRRDKQFTNIHELEVGQRFWHIFIAPIIAPAATGMKGVYAGEDAGAVIIIEDITEVKALQRSRDEFFSIASHELRTPLTAIRGNTSMILQYYARALKDPRLHEMVEDVYESSERLIEIVNDFLDVSRLEQGRLKFQRQAFDLAQLAADVVNEYRASGSAHKVKLTLDLPKHRVPLVQADPNRTKQVIINLVGNAMKFTIKGHVEIRITPQGKAVHLTVSDTGKGIPKELQHLLFHKFQQASGNILTRDDTRGTGLGLYISKLMIERMGGRIALEHSDEGKGSTFGFTLPIAKKGSTPNKQKPV